MLLISRQLNSFKVSNHTYTILWFGLIVLAPFESSGHSEKIRHLLEWGNTFGIPLESLNVITNCKHYDFEVCCNALNFSNGKPNHNKTRKRLLKLDDNCENVKTYYPSPYEKLHLQKAVELSQILDPNLRRESLISFLTSNEEVKASIIWLDLVKYLMKGNRNSSSSYKRYQMYKNRLSFKEYFKYLSYFNTTKTCRVEGEVIHKRSWIEWIEPLTVHARHPFGILQTSGQQGVDKLFSFNKSLLYPHFSDKEITSYLSSGLLNIDYILLQSSSRHVLEQSHFPSSSPLQYQKLALTSGNARPQKGFNYMFDAGASRFESSLWWFTCAYSQVGIDFDRLFGWEMTLLEPTSFWERVPPRWKSNYNFFNIPISANDSHHSNPFYAMRSLGVTENDFVALKLDVDAPEVEIPIALQLLGNPEVNVLVDEFFFELHFQCELLMPCCWGVGIPEEHLGLSLKRNKVLEFFSDLRKLGIRAHFWP